MNAYDWLPKRLKASLLRRARSFLTRVEQQALVAEFGIPEGTLPDAELLRVLSSIRAIVATEPDVLIDVGAHKGHFSLGASKFFRFHRILCFEPDEDLVPLLAESLKGLNATVLPIALSDRTGVAPLHIHPVRAMNSLLPSDEGVLDAHFRGDTLRSITTREVRAETLDGVICGDSGFQDSKFFIKLDTQGNELNILRAATNTLKRTIGCLVEFMFCTPYLGRASFSELVEFMTSHQMICQGALSIRRLPTHRVSAVDFLFVKEAVIPVS